MLELARDQALTLEAACVHPERMDEGVNGGHVERAFRQGMDQQVLRMHIRPAHHHIRLCGKHGIDLSGVLRGNDARDHRLYLLYLTPG